MYRLLWLFMFFPWPSRGQMAPVTRQDNQVHFQAPVEVYFRLNSPVAEAEYVLVMEAALVPVLDTLSFQGLLRHPGIYFSTLYSSTAPVKPTGKYRRARPVAQGTGEYPFNNQKVNVAPLERPMQGRFYTRKEAAANYARHFRRKAPSDFGPAITPDTLPGVDSVRVVYVLEKLPLTKRGPGKMARK
ncbi:hypothetical protein [Hymenobacter segetis]|uniref:Sulfatase-modifying factor enzyme domain-containing protein n=1 Tax=Hymenobacter segetis TaxID=2025509 RepID=A0ABU9M162_9BACT